MWLSNDTSANPPIYFRLLREDESPSFTVDSELSFEYGATQDISMNVHESVFVSKFGDEGEFKCIDPDAVISGLSIR